MLNFKHCHRHFDNFKGSEFWFWWICVIFEGVKPYYILKFRASKNAKIGRILNSTLCKIKWLKNHEILTLWYSNRNLNSPFLIQSFTNFLKYKNSTLLFFWTSLELEFLIWEPRPLVQGVPLTFLPFQELITLKICMLDPMMVKPECVLEAYILLKIVNQQLKNWNKCTPPKSILAFPT